MPEWLRLLWGTILLRPAALVLGAAAFLAAGGSLPWSLACLGCRAG